MFVENANSEFYEVVSGHKVLLLVGCDVDALCACRILQFLFHCDNVLYTLIPVSGKKSLREAFDLHREQARFVVMVNCGATLDLVELLEPPEDAVFFVADTHRPVNVYNAYSESQVRLLMSQEDCDGIPAYADIFRDEEEDSEDESEDSGGREGAMARRRERRLWEENRSRVMFDYLQVSYYGEPSALIMFNLAWKMSRDNRDLLWWAIVGLTEQLVLRKAEEDRYMLGATSLQGHLMRHSRDEQGSIHIAFDRELNLSLYRHWTLHESIVHSQYTASRLRLWSLKGRKRMLEFLAEMGLPLTQCHQLYPHMDMEYRNNIVAWMEGLADKYGLERITYGAFTSQVGYKGRFSAADVVEAGVSLLEAPKGGLVEDRFLEAHDALGKGESVKLRRGLELAKERRMAIVRQVQMFLDMKLVVNAGPFLYAIVNNATQDQRQFCRPETLRSLALFAQAAHCSASRNRSRAQQLPLLLFSSLEGEGRCLVVGVPPLSEDRGRHFFGRAFEQAAEQARVAVEQDLFSEQFAYVGRNDQAKFLNALFLMLN